MDGSAEVRGNSRRAVLTGTLVALPLALAACTEPSTPAPSSDRTDGPAQSVEAGIEERTIYLWDPNTGDAEALFSAVAQAAGLADAERSPDGTRVVYEHRIFNGPSQIYVAEADGTERPLTDLLGGAYDPAWSPDGQTIAFSGSRVEGSDLDIYTVDLAGGTERIAGTSKDDQHPDWSPDGTRIVFDARSGDPRSGPGAIWMTSVAAVSSIGSPRTPPGSRRPLRRGHRTGDGSRTASTSWGTRSMTGPTPPG